MPFISQKPRLKLSPEDMERLQSLTRSRKEKHALVDRAKVLLLFHGGETISGIAKSLHTSRPTVERCVNKALAQGIEAALGDLPRRGRPRRISEEAKTWVVDLACTKPTEHGYASELWTVKALAQHVRNRAREAGFPELNRANKSLIHAILKKREVRPHKIRYYLEKRDPEFELKKSQVLVVYKEVQEMNAHPDLGRKAATLSFDEKPGMQALGKTAPDLPPQPGEHPEWSRDHEYVRLGTLSLISAIDLHTGRVLGIVRERHRSREFIEFLQLVHTSYPEDWKIRMVLDNHSSHISKETQRFLTTLPNRFEFVFTPKHGSWLNLIENFYSKMTRSFLRGIRVQSKAELKERVEKYWSELNSYPVVFRWKYQLDEIKT